MSALAASGIRRVLLADLGKNVYPFVRSARRCGITIVAIADDYFAGPRRHYRDIRICTLAEAAHYEIDGVIVSNTSPVHAVRTQQRLVAMTASPVFRWFGYEPPSPFDEANSRTTPGEAELDDRLQRGMLSR